MEILRYLAYGSNLLPQRLRERVPSARPLGIVPLSDWRLTFDKRGRDGSAKCNLQPSSAQATDRQGHPLAFAAVYEIPQCERHALDAAEDLGRGYLEHRMHTPEFGPMFFYRAAMDFVDPSLTPFDWYHALVLAGARHHAFPASYLRQIEQITTRPDPDVERRTAALQLMRP